MLFNMTKRSGLRQKLKITKEKASKKNGYSSRDISISDSDSDSYLSSAI